ncbi:D-alanyl-D-alanine carboxypeptidase [Corynebacterium striatum]|nr:D-alanyl-D-alanine carboxypeptidase [Corynebacterium striatum]
MKAKHMWWTGTAVVMAAAIAGTAVLGVNIQRTYNGLDHGTPYSQEAPVTLLQVAEPGEVDLMALKGRLNELGKDPALATFGGQVIDTTTGEVVWDRDAARPLTPASSTKVLTLAAATLALDEDERIITQVMQGEKEGTVVLRAAGDVWMTSEQLDDLASQVGKADEVIVDTSAWAGAPQAPGWDPENVDEGFVAPMEPIMLYGGRLGETTGDVPRSHTPAQDLAKALAKRLGTDKVSQGTAPQAGVVLGEVQSAPLSERAQDAAKDSDNVMAEAIGRELAIARGKEPSFAGAAEATLEVLKVNKIDVTGVTIKDNSGLSTENRISAAVLTQIMNMATETDELRPLLGYLPLAGGDGTLYTRYGDSGARGFVRAKTGTLTGVSALAGTAQGNSGRVYAFAFLVNDGDILAARKAQDALAGALHDF